MIKMLSETSLCWSSFSFYACNWKIIFRKYTHLQKFVKDEKRKKKTEIFKMHSHNIFGNIHASLLSNEGLNIRTTIFISIAIDICKLPALLFWTNLLILLVKLPNFRRRRELNRFPWKILNLKNMKTCVKVVLSFSPKDTVAHN